MLDRLTPATRRIRTRLARIGVALLTAFATSAAASLGFAQEVIELPGEDRWLEANFEEVYRVGSALGDAWEEFGTIGRVGFDDAGNLHVFDRLAARVVVVNPNGDFVREFGRRGEGPGEFQSAMDMVVMSDGRVVIADMGHRAFHLFAPTGDLERMVRMGRIAWVRQMYPEAGGESVVRGARMLGSSFQFAGDSTIRFPDPRSIERIFLTGDEATVETATEVWGPAWTRLTERLIPGGGAENHEPGAPERVRTGAVRGCVTWRTHRVLGLFRVRNQARGTGWPDQFDTYPALLTGACHRTRDERGKGPQVEGSRRSSGEFGLPVRG